eukprot:CAMPEP_0173414750 /NCGR_PEP_ID=MMETSP1356-20130122/84490_1 /TAXON_ID=77927 ORGANISM="Hemiselmis virescens, Strain PCC157" /NCGR_SAMPLE_ID=MMETSP1356 /ASSEMBLY_ACC=CAM_ASM_000847 /LENGTH=480 /DNA_ID=CAMNT_0014376953 /DNA_START=96 /DNA_END=1538 /DNA_ORIENTATION=-
MAGSSSAGAAAMEVEDGFKFGLSELSKSVPGGADENLPPVTPSQGFDMESYISNYAGRTRAYRLKHIALRCPALQEEALRMMLHEVQSGQNVQLYKDVLDLCREKDKLGPIEKLRDQSWIDRVQESNDKTLEKLELDLCQHKLNSIKEKVRMGHNDLGHHHYNVGNLNEALKCYVRTRDYGTTTKHQTDMCLNIIKVGIEMNNYSHVVNYINKAEQASTEKLEGPVVGKLRAASGLAHLDSAKYKQAALKFVNMKIEVTEPNNPPTIKNIHPDDLAFNQVIAPQDIAIYGGLCALATFDRAELSSKVIDDVAFKQFLELVPDMRELIFDFYGSRYSSCLALMDKIKGDVSLDMYLGKHVDSLYESIRSRALIQYFTPYASVKMSLMAEAFSTTVDDLQKELAQLIMKKEIKARIDSHNKIVFASHADQEASTYRSALQMGLQYEKRTAALLLRADLILNDLCIKAQRGMGPPRGDPRDED